MEYRIIHVGDQFLSVVGIVDLCVAPHARRTGLGASLLDRAEHTGRGQSFALAMADDTRLYDTQGYQRVNDALVTFLAIDDLRSHSLIERNCSDFFMCKPLGKRTGIINALRANWMEFAQDEAGKGNPPQNAGAAFVTYCKKQESWR